jgi:hypothetical protein
LNNPPRYNSSDRKETELTRDLRELLGQPAVNKEFGACLDRLMTKAGMGNRDLWRASGVNHATIGTARDGFVPKYETLERIAAGIPHLSPRQRYELFNKAGYTMAEGTPQERLLDWLKEFQERHGPLTLHFSGGAASLTHEQVDALIQFYEAEVSSAETERSVTNDAHPKVSEEPPP